MDGLDALMMAEMAMTSEERVEVDIAIRDMWLIVNALQLSMTHPGLHEPVRSWMEEIGRRCQAVIVTVLPPVEELLEAGWHRENDIEQGDNDYDGWEAGLPFNDEQPYIDDNGIPW